jgi:flagellar hook assembly protein FlgD
VRFTLPATTEAWIGIYDISGRLVRTCVDNTLRAGVYSFRLDLRDVRSGIYFVRMWTPQKTLRERLVLMR